MSESSLPYSTPEFPGIGGRIKQRPEDFFVQEQPLYEPSGEGEHVYAEIQKVGLTTFDVADHLVRALNVSPRDIGYAGMKDANAITRQIFSIRGTTEQAVMGLRRPDMTVQWASRHVNKLRLGHLAGNRFAIKVRDVNPTDVVKLEPVLRALEQHGLPNYFGEQRFGRRSNNDLLGAALVRGDYQELLHLLLGDPIPRIDDPKTRAARETFDKNDLAASMKLWPRRSGTERRILARLIKTKHNAAAVKAIDERLRRLWVSALQSKIFNDVLARRVADGTFAQLLDGDLAYKHDNGACFRVESAASEQARTQAFEVSPTGPLIGYRMTLPQGRPLEIEQEVLGAFHLSPESFRSAGRLKVKGARRPLRVKPTKFDLAGGVDEHGSHITVAFTLPSGAFATILMRELMKGGQTDQTPTANPDEDLNELDNDEAPAD
ncbi:MAG: tRNA pseudouridine(13) synthase TruD [Tepidisphaeraceae bacterium]